MRPLESNMEKELLGNAKQALDDCLAKVKAGKYQESLLTLLIGIDVLANLNAQVSGQVTREREAKKNNRSRFIGFLRQEIPEWIGHEMQWQGKTFRLDFVELSYEVRCKQVHEYSSLTSANFPIRLDWDHCVYGDPFMRAFGTPKSSMLEYVEVNGFLLLQRLVEVAQKYIGIFSASSAGFDITIDPFAIYKCIGNPPRYTAR